MRIYNIYFVKVIVFLLIHNLLIGDINMLEKNLTFKSSNSSEVDLSYLLYLPDNYDEVDSSLPLVLFLHGAGERGDDLGLVKKHGIPKRIEKGDSFPFICIAPQCPREGYWDRPEYVNTLFALVDKVKENFSLKSNKVYGTGLSMGGLGVLEMAIQNPSFFSAIIPVCGGANLEQIDRLKSLPIWLFHGDRDMVHRVENSINIYQKLQSKNNNIHLTVYGNTGHDSWTITYDNDEIYNWLINFK